MLRGIEFNGVDCYIIDNLFQGIDGQWCIFICQGFVFFFMYDFDDWFIGVGVNDFCFKVQIGVYGMMVGGGLGVGDNYSNWDYFIELQFFFVGVYFGDCFVEDEVVFVGGSGQWFR